jgi:hypothetical protein
MSGSYIIGASSIAFISALGCQQLSTDAPAGASSLTSTVSPIVGYVHSQSSSHFDVGSGISSLSDGGFQKVIGSNGVFAVDMVTGWALSIPNGDAPITTRPPLTGTADDHNRAALAYFASVGIPQDQVSGVHANTLMAGGMPANSTTRVPDHLKAYYSVLERTVDGLSVVESKAWVRFNVDGSVVEESVFWPELPGSIHGDILAMKTAVVDGLPNRLKSPTAVLNYRSGRIQIHHSQAWDHRSFAAIVTYDVMPVNTHRARTHHFDVNGNEIDVISDGPPPG